VPASFEKRGFVAPAIAQKATPKGLALHTLLCAEPLSSERITEQVFFQMRKNSMDLAALIHMVVEINKLEN
jgi:hypothetical protein